MFYTLRVRIAVTFILLLVVPLVTISAVLTKVSNDVIGKSIADSTSQTMDQYAAFVNTLTRQVEDVANQVLSNEVTQKWIAAQLKNELTPEERVVLSAELRKYLSSVALNNSVVSSITVFDHKGRAIGIGDQVIRDASYLQSKWYDEFVNQGIRWAKVHEDPHQPNYLRSKPVNSLLFPMVQLESFRNVGVLKVNFLSAQLEEQINRIQFGTSSRLFILDRSGNPVIRQNGSDPPSMLGSEWETIWTDKRVGGERTLDIDGEEHMLFFRKLPVTDWILIVQIPRKELYQKLESVQRTIVWISGLLLIVTVAAAGSIWYYEEDGSFNYGQSLKLQWGVHRPDGSFEALDEVQPIDVFPQRAWRNLRFPLSWAPPEANVVRIVADDPNLSEDQWFAFTPPRVPVLQTAQEFLGSDTPVLMDIATAANFMPVAIASRSGWARAGGSSG